MLFLCASFPQAHAQSGADNAQAQVYFDRGNALAERAQRFRGARRQAMLEEALTNYVSAIRIVPSRNVLFNAGMVLEQLERPAQAFGYYQRYLQIEGLSAEERAQADARIAEIRPTIATASIVSEPPGADVFVDRLDLAAVGQTPLEVALPPGSHRVFLRLEYHEGADLEVATSVGQTAQVRQALTPNSVPLRITAGEHDEVTLDGESIDASVVQNVRPGEHRVTLTRAGRTIEESVQIRAGQDAAELSISLDLRTALTLESNVDAQFFLDGSLVGAGTHVEVDVEPGEHEVRASADGYSPAEETVRVELGERRQVRADLRPPSNRSAAPHVMLGVTGALLVTSGVLTAVTAVNHGDWESECGGMPQERCTQERHSRIENLALATDILWGATVLSGGVTLLMYLLRGDESAGSTLNVDVSLSPVGGQLQLRGAF